MRITKKNHVAIVFLLSLLVIGALIKLSACGGSSSSSGGGTTPTTESFTNGAQTLTADTSATSDTKTVTVTNSSGTNVVTLSVTTTGVTMSAPGQTDATMTFRQPLAALPTDYTAERMAVFAAGIMTTGNSLSARPDNPGCDWFPDSQCTLGCCADHDQCYRANSCGASSWIWGFGSEACKNCNNIAYDCIGAACVGVTESFTANNCYDAKCNKNYDCPPNYNSCTCKDICADEGITVPDACGDGTCATGETVENCYSDCAFGTSASECCVDSGNCPSETEDTCTGGCCCCGIGLTCNTSSMCAAGDFF